LEYPNQNAKVIFLLNEVKGPIDWVNDPNNAGQIFRPLTHAFLTNDAMVWEVAGNLIDKVCLCRLIHLRN